MKIELQTSGTDPVTAGDLRRCVEYHVRRSLRQVRRYVERVRVRITDLNGPRGGADKLCTMQVSITGQRPVFVRDIRSDMGAAISRAAERAGATSIKRVRQRRELRMERRLPGAGGDSSVALRRARLAGAGESQAPSPIH